MTSPEQSPSPERRESIPAFALLHALRQMPKVKRQKLNLDHPSLTAIVAEVAAFILHGKRLQELLDRFGYAETCYNRDKLDLALACTKDAAFDPLRDVAEYLNQLIAEADDPSTSHEGHQIMQEVIASVQDSIQSIRADMQSLRILEANMSAQRTFRDGLDEDTEGPAL